MENESVNEVAGLFKELNTVALIEIAAILLAAWFVVWLSQRLLPWLANHLHGKRRLYTLALVPMVRILVLVLALVLMIGGVVGAQFGVRAGQNMRGEYLRLLLGVLVLLVGMRFAYDLVVTPADPYSVRVVRTN